MKENKTRLAKLMLAAALTFGAAGCSKGESTAAEAEAPAASSNNTSYEASKIELADMNDPAVVDEGLVFVDVDQLTSGTSFTYQGSVVSFTGFKRDQTGPQNIIMAYNKDNTVNNNKVTVFVGTAEEFEAYKEENGY